MGGKGINYEKITIGFFPFLLLPFSGPNHHSQFSSCRQAGKAAFCEWEGKIWHIYECSSDKIKDGRGETCQYWSRSSSPQITSWKQKHNQQQWGFPEEITFIPTTPNPFSPLYENTPNLHSKKQNISTFIKNPLLLHATRLRMGKWAQGNAYETFWNAAKYRKTWITLPQVIH